MSYKLNEYATLSLYYKIYPNKTVNKSLSSNQIINYIIHANTLIEQSNILLCLMNMIEQKNN